MAVLGSTLGLLLCLGLLFSPASARNHSEHCMPFTNIVASSGPGIQVNATVYENITIYTVLVPVNKNISSVALRAADMNNTSVGTWEGADEYCNSSVLYHVKDSDSDRGLLETKWGYPNSKHKTEVILKVFAVDLNRTALFSSLKLNTEEITTTTNPKISSQPPTTSHTSSTRPSMSPVTVPTTHTTHTLHTTQHTTSSASTAFLNPIINTIQILLLFLTSKLLF